MASRRKIKRIVKWIITFLLIGIFLPFAVQKVFSTPCLGQKKLDHYDLIIVLGNPANNECLPGPVMRERVNKGVQLFKEGYAPRLLFTGSAVANNCIEAITMSNYAFQIGVPDSCILKECKARNTYQNAYYAVEMMKSMKYSTALIVTSGFHIERACHIFSNYNITFDMKACQDPTDLGVIKKMWSKIREKFLLTYHCFFGYQEEFGL